MIFFSCSWSALEGFNRRYCSSVLVHGCACKPFHYAVDIPGNTLHMIGKAGSWWHLNWHVWIWIGGADKIHCLLWLGVCSRRLLRVNTQTLAHLKLEYYLLYIDKLIIFASAIFSGSPTVSWCLLLTELLPLLSEQLVACREAAEVSFGSSDAFLSWNVYTWALWPKLSKALIEL